MGTCIKLSSILLSPWKTELFIESYHKPALYNDVLLWCSELHKINFQMRVVFQFMPKNNQKSVCEKELLIFTKKKDKKSYPNVSRCWDLEWEVSSRNSNRATQNKAGRDRQWKISRKLVRNVSKDSRTTAKTLETQENDLTKSGIVMPKKTFTGTSHMEWTVSIDQEKVHFCRRDAFKPDWSILRTTSRMIRYTTSLSRDVLSACL